MQIDAEPHAIDLYPHYTSCVGVRFDRSVPATFHAKTAPSGTQTSSKCGSPRALDHFRTNFTLLQLFCSMKNRVSGKNIQSFKNVTFRSANRIRPLFQTNIVLCSLSARREGQRALDLATAFWKLLLFMTQLFVQSKLVKNV